MRATLIVLVAVTAVGAGTIAGPLAFAMELQWPLSEPALNQSLRSGFIGGLVCASLWAVALYFIPRKYLWYGASAAVLTTWLLSFACNWWKIMTSLG